VQKMVHMQAKGGSDSLFRFSPEKYIDILVPQSRSIVDANLKIMIMLPRHLGLPSAFPDLTLSGF
jgi:hypothetical protein